MLKTFCDGCGKQTTVDHLTQPKTGRYEFKPLTGGAWIDFRVLVEIRLSLVPVEPPNNNGTPVRHLCEDCAWRAIDSLDERPRAVVSAEEVG